MSKHVILEQKETEVVLEMQHQTRPDAVAAIVVDQNRKDGNFYVVPGGKSYRIRGEAIRAAIPMFRAAGFRTNGVNR